MALIERNLPNPLSSVIRTLSRFAGQRKWIPAVYLCLLSGVLALGAKHATPAETQGSVAAAPQYTKSGDLVPPLDYRRWVYLTSGLDMSYSAKSGGMSRFDNVFASPAAYSQFVATGHWPEKTILVLEVRGAASKGSINKNGHFQTSNLMGMEVHVRDSSRFPASQYPGGWAFFDVASKSKATLIPQTADCYRCHQAHGAVDTTFVQFYPTLLPIATQMGTLSTTYQAEASGKNP